MGDRKNIRCMGMSGDACPRCRRPTLRFKRTTITDKDRAKKHYYSSWFICTNKSCPTSVITPERFKMDGSRYGPGKHIYHREGPPPWQREGIKAVAETAETAGTAEKPPWED